MTDADHLAHPQALHGHHGLHPHSLGHPHGLSVGHPHAHHADLHHSQLQQSGENGVGIEDQDDDPRDDEGLDDAEMHSDGDHAGDQRTQLAVRSQGATQLTLTYQGEAYVFDTVPPEKVQAVLLLIGRREIPPGMSGVAVPGHHHSNKCDCFWICSGGRKMAEGGGQGQGEAQAHVEVEHKHRGHVHGLDGHDQGLQQSGEDGVGIEDKDDYPRDDEGLDDAEMHSDGDHPGDQRTQLAVRSQGATQLTLTYQGEADVFDTVPPEKVQAVLLLLGGREIPPGMSGVAVPGHHHSNKDAFDSAFEAVEEHVTTGHHGAYILDGEWISGLSELNRMKVRLFFEEQGYFETLRLIGFFCYESIEAMAGDEDAGEASSCEFVGGEGLGGEGESNRQGTQSLPSLPLSVLDESEFEMLTTESLVDAAEEAVVCGNECRSRKLHILNDGQEGNYRNRLKFSEVFEITESNFVGLFFPLKPVSLKAMVGFECRQQGDIFCISIFYLRGEIVDPEEKALSCLRMSIAAAVNGEAIQLHVNPRTEDLLLRIVDRGVSVEEFHTTQRHQGLDLQMAPTASLNIATVTPSVTLGQLKVTGSHDSRLLRQRGEPIALVTLERASRHVLGDQEGQYTLELRRSYANTWFASRSSEQALVEFSDSILPIKLVGKIPQDLGCHIRSLIVTCGVECDISQLSVTARNPKVVIAEGRRKSRTLSFNRTMVLSGE